MQQLFEDLPFRGNLPFISDVLPLTAAAFLEVWTHRSRPPWTGFYNPDDPGANEVFLLFNCTYQKAVSRCGERDEHYFAHMPSQSVAVIGASRTVGAFGNRVMQHLASYEGKVWAVNPKYDSVEGRPCVPSVDALEELPLLGGDVAPSLVSDVLGREIWLELDQAIASGVLEHEHEVLRFAHPVYAEAVEARIGRGSPAAHRAAGCDRW